MQFADYFKIRGNVLISKKRHHTKAFVEIRSMHMGKQEVWITKLGTISTGENNLKSILFIENERVER